MSMGAQNRRRNCVQSVDAAGRRRYRG